MATFYDIAGTTQHYFTIGGKNGVTTYIGNTTPDSSIGKPGDTYIQSERSLDDAIVSTYATKADLLNDTTTTFYTGYYAEVTSDEDHNNHTTVYEYDGSQWNFIYDSTIDDEPLFVNYGKIFTKSIIEGEEKWSSSSTYVTDEPILKTTEVGAGVYMLSAQSATNTNITSSSSANDYVNNHNAYGVTRFATDSEANNGVNKFITVTPSQVTNVITNNLSPIQNDIINISNRIDTISAGSDVFDVVGTYADLQNYNKSTLTDNDVIKVLSDSTHSNAAAYYRYYTSNNSFSYFGQEGPYYTTTEVDTKFVSVSGAQTINGIKTFNDGIRSNETIAANSNDTTVPTTAWVQSSIANFVTLSGTQTISGNKTFTGDVSFGTNTTAVTPSSGDSSNKIATTEFVANSISAVGQIPPMATHNGQFLSTDGTNAIWAPVTMTLNGLSDVTLNAQSDGQTIVYNNTSNKWENGNPTVATIRYW